MLNMPASLGIHVIRPQGNRIRPDKQAFLYSLVPRLLLCGSVIRSLQLEGETHRRNLLQKPTSKNRTRWGLTILEAESLISIRPIRSWGILLFKNCRTYRHRWDVSPSCWKMKSSESFSEKPVFKQIEIHCSRNSVL